MEDVAHTGGAGVRLLRINPDVVERTALGRSTIYEEIASGRLRAVKIGRSIRVRSDDLDRWIEDRTHASESAA